MPHYSLSASLIFDSRQQKQYRRFQLQSDNFSADKLGVLPTAAEYAAFEVWRKGNDSGYFSDTPLCDPILDALSDAREEDGQSEKVTASCGHALHPAQYEQETDNTEESPTTKKSINRCPACVLEMHTRYTDLLLRTLKSAGGFMDQRWEAPPDDNPILEAYEAVKIRLVQAITRVDRLASAEREWELRHPDSSIPAGVKTAEEALRKYWAGVEFATPRSSPPPGSRSSSRGDEEKPKRSIRFSEDTQFDRGRDMIYFHRRSHRYEPGGRHYVSPEARVDLDDDSEAETDREDEGDATKTRLPLRLSCPEMPFSSSEEGAVENIAEEEEEEVMSDDGDSDWEDVESEAGDEGFLFETGFIEFGY